MQNLGKVVISNKKAALAFWEPPFCVLFCSVLFFSSSSLYFPPKYLAVTIICRTFAAVIQMMKDMEIMNNDFWKRREVAMKRFMAAKERKRQRMAELETLLRQDYVARTGEEPKLVNVW